MNKTIASIELQHFPINKYITLLDFGFGDGSKSLQFSRLGVDITAADVDRDNISYLKAKIKKFHIKNIKAVKLDGGKLPFISNSFDRIIANEVLEHIPNTRHTLRELYRITKPGGIICISIPTTLTETIYSKINSNYLYNAGHVHIFKDQELITQIKNVGFSIQFISYKNFQFALFWLIQSLFKINPNGNGKPYSKPRFDVLYWKLWGVLHILKLGNPLIELGNHILPKSIYIYAKKN